MSAMTAAYASPIMMAMDRSLAQSPIHFALAGPSSSNANMRNVRPIVGLGFDFLQMPSIHHVLDEFAAYPTLKCAEEENEHSTTKPAVLPLDTPACEALFDTPYVDALFDVLSPDVRGPSHAEERLSQAFWAMVAVLQWYFQPFCGVVPGLCLAYHGAIILLTQRSSMKGMGAVACATCAALVLGLFALILLATVSLVGVSCFARTWM